MKKNNILIFKKSKRKVVEALKKGDIDYVAQSKWSFADKLMAFLLAIGFFSFAEETYPCPRMRKNIPLWILIGLMLQLKLSLKNAFLSLPGILKSGAVLTRTSFNIGKVEGGFNSRNKHSRTEGEIINQDTLRKYLKDTDAEKLLRWNNTQVPKFLASKGAIRAEGIFTMDGTHLIVPNNRNYEGAQYVPLDKDKRFVNVEKLPKEEAKRFRYTLCYKMVNLMHLSRDKNYFTFLGTKISGGKAHDKVLGGELIEDFVKEVGKGKIKLLILDRGFLDGRMMADFKNDYAIDTLIPLKKNMAAHLDAAGLSRLNDKPWKKVDKHTSCYLAKRITSYEGCRIPLNIIIVKSRLKGGKVRLWSLATTRNYSNPVDAVADYRLRWQIEERYRQLKESWLGKRFNTTCFNLIVAHIIFSLMVYTFIQAYLNISSLKRLANKTIETLKADEAVGKDSVIMCAGGYYGALDASESLYYVAFLEGEALKRFRNWITQFRKNKYRKNNYP